MWLLEFSVSVCHCTVCYVVETGDYCLAPKLELANSNLRWIPKRVGLVAI